MTTLVTVAFVVTWVALACGGWFGYQLLRQNGRVLRRVEAIEDELARNAEDGTSGARPFGDRSLAGSRINRSGLTPGTAAPPFRLPRVDGGELSLEEYTGRRVLLVFSSPDCAPCDLLVPKLEQASRRSDAVTVLMVSRGDAEVNLRKIAEHGLTFRVVLQRSWEVSRAYAKFVTPMAYLIDERGVIVSNVAVGAEPILALLSGAVSDAGGWASGHGSDDVVRH